MLLDLCNQRLSVAPGEVRVRSYNFCWSVARHKLLILTEQSPPVQQTGHVPDTGEGFSDFSCVCGQRIIADGKRCLAQMLVSDLPLAMC